MFFFIQHLQTFLFFVTLLRFFDAFLNFDVNISYVCEITSDGHNTR